MEFISKTDYGEDSQRHIEGLKKLISEQNGIVNSEQSWFPYEVVELSRWSMKVVHEREFAISNVIIALSILGGMGTTNSVEYMFDRLSNEYERLPLELSNIVLNILYLASAFQEKN